MAQQMENPEPCQHQHMHGTVLPGLAGSCLLCAWGVCRALGLPHGWTGHKCLAHHPELHRKQPRHSNDTSMVTGKWGTLE